MPYNRRFSEPFAPVEYDEGPASRLVKSLIGIQERKRMQAIQDERLRMEQEEARRRAQAEDLEREMKLAEVAAKAEALKPGKEVETTPDLHPATGAEGVPQGVLTDVAPPEQPSTVKVGQFEIPILNRAQLQERADEDFQRKLEQERQLVQARERRYQLPEDERLGALGGMEIPEAAVGQAITGMLRPQRQIERSVDLGDHVRVYYTDGTTSDEPKGAPPRDPSQGSGAMKQYTDKRSGEVVFLNNEDAAIAAKEGWLAPGPTSEMRNMSYQAGAVEPAFDLVENSLNNLEMEQQGMGRLTQLVPGSRASYALSRFRDQAKALLGAIVARQAGEGSRLSDEDRRVYARSAALVDNLLMLPGGTQEARERLREARALLSTIQQRRAISGAGAGATAPTAPTPTQPTQTTIDPEVQRRLDRYR